MPDRRVFRIFDANLNRFCEGSRVIEESLRFILDRPADARLVKEMRHQARSVFRAARLKDPAGSRPGGGTTGQELLLTHRDTLTDPGTAARYDRTILKRRRLSDLMLANFKRMQEAVRVLEEYSRLVLSRKAAVFKSLRFKLYELEKRVMLGSFDLSGHSRLKKRH